MWKELTALSRWLFSRRIFFSDVWVLNAPLGYFKLITNFNLNLFNTILYFFHLSFKEIYCPFYLAITQLVYTYLYFFYTYLSFIQKEFKVSIYIYIYIYIWKYEYMKYENCRRLSDDVVVAFAIYCYHDIISCWCQLPHVEASFSCQKTQNMFMYNSA